MEQGIWGPVDPSRPPTAQDLTMAQKRAAAREAIVQVCFFHGRPYPDHDFFYGPQCRRCGTEQAS